MRTGRLLNGLLLLTLTAGLALAQDGGDWLNARDFGASGSQFQTQATTVVGSNQITVADPGDFKVGQGVMVSRCNIQMSNATLWGPRAKYASSRAVKEEVQFRGYDGSLGSWTVYILDIDGTNPLTFRWTDDLCRTWKESKVPITGDWQKLSGGTEVKFGKLDWESGYSVSFSARDQLVATIEKIEGKVLTLSAPANRAATDAIVRHNDTGALQQAIDAAMKQGHNLYFPPGWYRLSGPLNVVNARSLTLQGANAVDTVLDISEGSGACLSLRDGTEVTIRNFRLLGGMGFAERDQAGSLPTKGGTALWGFYFKPSHALNILQTERVLVENCHASRMSGECFYASGRARQGTKPEPKQMTREITYLRCSVTDSARNAFNNNNMSENTRVLYCRIVDVGGCSWEGASRFVQFVGNYVRNAGTVAMGNVRSRDEQYEVLGTGQHVVSDNVFEGVICYGGAAIRAAASANEIVITNNLFVNFGSSGIDLSGVTSTMDLPTRHHTVSGNIMDMTEVGPQSKPRIAVDVSASGVIVSDNQIYVRGTCDPQVTALRLREPLTDLNVHDNLIANCGNGVSVARGYSWVDEVKSPTIFLSRRGYIPLEFHQGHRYRGWHVVFLRANKVLGQGIIKEFDPDSMEFRLTKPGPMQVGDSFEVYPPEGANWNLHDNTLSACQNPVILDGYGSRSSVLCNNTISRDGLAGVKQAVDVRGLFQLEDNRFFGFDEPDSAVLKLSPTRLGKPAACLVRGNTFQQCRNIVAETEAGLWKACVSTGNIFVDCASQPAQSTALPGKPPTAPLLVSKPAAALLTASPLKKPVKVDGEVGEWNWKSPNVAAVQESAGGGLSGLPKSSLLAAYDKTNLYLAVRVALTSGYKVKPGDGAYSGDGQELSIQNPNAQGAAPVFVFWGSPGGKAVLSALKGVTDQQAEAVMKRVSYAAKITPTEWTCEWRIPLSDLGSPKPGQKLMFNLGLRYLTGETWVGWRSTGGALCDVEKAGELLLATK